jgi:DNA primase
MLKANVGLSRKLSENYQSTGFSLNLEGEINASLDNPETVIERVRELYDLADEALQRQIEAHQSDSAIASRDADPKPSNNGHSNGRPAPDANGQPSRNGHRNEKPQNGEPATNKQVAFLQTLAKRQKLIGPKLEEFIEETIGRRSTPYDLSKKEAGAVIEALNPESSENNHSRR